MNDRPLTHAGAAKPILGKRRLKWEPIAMLYARFALAAAFLSAVAARFGIWGENAGPDSFKHFLEYAAEVNSFMPAFTIPFLAWAATVAETFLGVALVLGIWARFVALAAALLLALFGSNRRWITRYFPHPREHCCYPSARPETREVICERI